MCQDKFSSEIFYTKQWQFCPHNYCGYLRNYVCSGSFFYQILFRISSLFVGIANLLYHSLDISSWCRLIQFFFFLRNNIQWKLPVLLSFVEFWQYALSNRNSRWSCLFFVVYVLLGVYFLTNLILAVVYDSFKAQVFSCWTCDFVKDIWSCPISHPYL